MYETQLSEDEEDVDEEEIALDALAALMEVEGDDELALAQQEALVLVAQEALALKERRQARERQVTALREAEHRRRVASEAAAREAARLDTALRARQARERAEREEARRLNASRLAREAHQAAVARAEAERRERVRREEERRELRRAEQRRLTIESAQVKMPPPSPRPVREERSVIVGCVPVVPMERSEHSHPTEATRSVLTEPSSKADALASAKRAPQPTEGASAELPPLTGADLAAWRARLGLTQQVAADRLGVRQGTISKAESRAQVLLGAALHGALAGELGREPME